MLFFDGRCPRYALPVLAEYIRPNVYPRKSNSPSGTLQMRVFSSLTVSFSFPPPALPGFSGTTSLSATPQCPASPSRASGWSSLTALWGFPCCARFPCVRAAASTPVQRLGVVFDHLTQPYQPSPKLQSGRPTHRPFRGLRGVHLRCGPHTRAVTYM